MENDLETPDFDQLKATWNRYLHQQAEAAEYMNRQQLSDMMQQRTHTLFARLMRNLMIEIVSTLLMLAAAFAWTLQTGHPWPWYVWLLILVVTFTGHLLLYWSLRRQDRLSEASLVQALDTAIRHTGRFVRTGKQTAWIAAAITLLGGFQILSDSAMQGRQAWILAVFAVLAAIGVYTLVNFYIESLYGKHYRHLVACRQTLE